MNAFPEIPGYRIERRLGEGGMASVYLATQLSLDRPVAIKVVHFRGHDSDQMAARFEHEARTLARLEHPHIVGVYEVGRTRAGLPYYAMAFLPNGDLAQAKLQGDPVQIAAVLRAVAQALGFAHAQGVVHRDVKPENVLFDREQRARLADFGISRSLGSVRLTQQGDALGSAAYMSPEQSRGQEVDARSDLYSLGVVAFELLTGTLPFRGEDAVAMALAHHADPVPRLPARYASWQPLIDRALAKRPEDRFASAAGFIATLDRIQPPVDPRATEAVSGFAPPSPRLRARPWLWLAAGGLLALVIAGLGLRMAAPPQATTAAQTRVQAELALIADRIAAGRWFEPEAGSAAELLGRALTLHRDEATLAAADAFVLAVQGGLLRAIDESRDGDALPLVSALRGFVAKQRLQRREATREFEAALAGALGTRLASAEASGDPLAIELLAGLLAEQPQLAQRWKALNAKRHEGQSLRDIGGPPLRILRSGDVWLAFAETEVMRGDYARFVASSGRAAHACREIGKPLSLVRPRTWREPGFAQNAQHPVVCVTHEDARAYARWLSQQTGRRYRLPSAAEWRAAAAGVDASASACTLGNVYGRDGRDLNLRERHDCTDGAEDTRQVAGYAASRDGLFDLVGNVAEWTGDCSAAGDCGEREVMGSSYRDGRGVAPLGLRERMASDRAALDIGFRVVREL